LKVEKHQECAPNFYSLGLKSNFPYLIKWNFHLFLNFQYKHYSNFNISCTLGLKITKWCLQQVFNCTIDIYNKNFNSCVSQVINHYSCKRHHDIINVKLNAWMNRPILVLQWAIHELRNHLMCNHCLGLIMSNSKCYECSINLYTNVFNISM
jgi:hypothetical protein